MTTVSSPLADALQDRYTIERELGRGGMVTVWLARDLRHKRPVALKVLRTELGAMLGAEHFLREIRPDREPEDTLDTWTTESLLDRLEQIAPGFQGWADKFKRGTKRPGNN